MNSYVETKSVKWKYPDSCISTVDITIQSQFYLNFQMRKSSLRSWKIQSSRERQGIVDVVWAGFFLKY